MQEWTVGLRVEYLPLPVEQLAAWQAGLRALDCLRRQAEILPQINTDEHGSLDENSFEISIADEDDK